MQMATNWLTMSIPKKRGQNAGKYKTTKSAPASFLITVSKLSTPSTCHRAWYMFSPWWNPSLLWPPPSLMVVRCNNMSFLSIRNWFYKRNNRMRIRLFVHFCVKITINKIIFPTQPKKNNSCCVYTWKPIYLPLSTHTTPLQKIKNSWSRKNSQMSSVDFVTSQPLTLSTSWSIFMSLCTAQ